MLFFLNFSWKLLQHTFAAGSALDGAGRGLKAGKDKRSSP